MQKSVSKHNEYNCKKHSEKKSTSQIIKEIIKNNLTKRGAGIVAYTIIGNIAYNESYDKKILNKLIETYPIEAGIYNSFFQIKENDSIRAHMRNLIDFIADTIYPDNDTSKINVGDDDSVEVLAIVNVNIDAFYCIKEITNTKHPMMPYYLYALKIFYENYLSTIDFYNVLFDPDLYYNDDEIESIRSIWDEIQSDSKKVKHFFNHVRNRKKIPTRLRLKYPEINNQIQKCLGLINKEKSKSSILSLCNSAYGDSYDDDCSRGMDSPLIVFSNEDKMTNVMENICNYLDECDTKKTVFTISLNLNDLDLDEKIENIKIANNLFAGFYNLTKMILDGTCK